MVDRILENEYLKVKIDDLGAELISVFDKETGEERIWNADKAVWNRHAPILFPFVGKVNGGVYRCGGKSYEMKSQHGFARDKEFTCVAASDSFVTHCLKADETTLQCYPFFFELYVTHRFGAKNGRMLEVHWEIKNCGGDSMHYSIGGHPGFCVPEGEKGSRDEYFLEFPGKERLSYILLSPDTGLAVPQKEYGLKLEEGRHRIEKNMFDADALIFENSQIETVRILRPDKTPYISLYCEGFPYVGIWSKPEGRFVCLEPWLGRTDDDGFAGELSEKAGEQTLPAGETRKIMYAVEFHS